ncbi:MAG: HAMP domain-containing sensor histidine kinase [Candidatus Cloacimonadales bacterium]
MLKKTTILYCDQDYQIVEVLKNELQLQLGSEDNASFFHLIQTSEVNKAYDFFRKIKLHNFMINQELQLQNATARSSFVFSGILAQEKFLIVLTENLLKFAQFSELLKSNNLFQPEMQESLDSADEGNLAENIFYEEMTKINNELVNMQRSISKKNLQLEQQQAHLELINKILRHDLANLFSTIKSAVRVFQSNSETKYLSAISDKAQIGVELIGNMRELENIFRSQVNLQPVNLRLLLAKLARSWTELEIELDLPSVEILANSSLKSLFDNLYRNAVMHGKASKVEIRGEAEGKNFILRFADNGQGIPAEIREKIFDENFKYGATGNSGLGLFIVKQLVISYQAEISVKENQPQGTLFEIKFRIYQN